MSIINDILNRNQDGYVTPNGLAASEAGKYGVAGVGTDWQGVKTAVNKGKAPVYVAGSTNVNGYNLTGVGHYNNTNDNSMEVTTGTGVGPIYTQLRGGLAETPHGTESSYGLAGSYRNGPLGVRGEISNHQNDNKQFQEALLQASYALNGGGNINAKAAVNSDPNRSRVDVNYNQPF